MKPKVIFPLSAIALCSSLLFFPSLSLSQKTTPLNLAQNIPIGNLNQTRTITISGKIVGWGEADENEFLLQDASGTVLVDAGPRWWKDLNLALGDTLTVQGAMDDGEFDAFSLTYSDGTVVEIRSPFGPPPWAGGPRNRSQARPVELAVPQTSRSSFRTISGEIVAWGEADENEFILATTAGQIRVDAGPRWWKNLNLSLGETITVQGEMDDGEFDAFSLTYADGKVVEIRSPGQEEPWDR